MTKDEMIMIEEMAKVLCNRKCGECEYIPRLCGYKSYCTRLYNAGCRIIADDEIVIKKKQYEQLKKYNRDRKRLRLKWQQAKQETAREILALIGKPNYKGDDWYEGAFYKQEQIREQIADIYGIELED